MNCLECATKYEENIQGTIFKRQMVIIFLQIRTNLEVLMCICEIIRAQYYKPFIYYYFFLRI